MNKNKSTRIIRKATRLAIALCLAICNAPDALADNRLLIEGFQINPGEEKVLAVAMENTDPISSMQMDIKLPKGLIYLTESVKRNENRLDRSEHTVTVGNATATADGGNLHRILILASNANNIIGSEGDLFYIKLKATETFTSQNEIEISRIIGSSQDGNQKFELENATAQVSPIIGNITLGAEALSVKPDEAYKIDVQLNGEYPLCGMQCNLILPEGAALDTKANGNIRFDYAASLAENVIISSHIEGNIVHLALSSLTNSIFDVEKTPTLFSFYLKPTADMAETAELKIADIIVTDKNANTFDMEASAMQITNMQKPYARLNEEIAAVQTLLSDTLAAIAEECKDVAEQFKGEEIQAQIDALTADVQTKYEAGELTAESTIDVTAIEAAIGQLFADAKTAQQIFEKIAANEAAYARLNEEIAAVQTLLSDTLAAIAEECKDVAEQFKGEEIQAQIDALTADVQTKYEAGELTAESTIDVTAIEAAIGQLFADAKTAQDNYQATRPDQCENVGTYELKVYAQQDNTYKPEKAALDLEDVAAKFGISVEEVANAAIYVANAEGNFEAGQANNGGAWFTAEGNTTNWGNSSVFFVEPTTAQDYSVFHIGQYPDACQPATIYHSTMYLVIGSKMATLNFTLRIADPNGIDATLSDEDIVSTEYFTLSGAQIDAPAQSTYIERVTYSNGTVKSKVVIQ